MAPAESPACHKLLMMRCLLGRGRMFRQRCLHCVLSRIIAAEVLQACAGQTSDEDPFAPDLLSAVGESRRQLRRCGGQSQSSWKARACAAAARTSLSRSCGRSGGSTASRWLRRHARLCRTATCGSCPPTAKPPGSGATITLKSHAVSPLCASAAQRIPMEHSS